MIELPLLIEDIKRILPHRYPFLLVDRIIEFELENRIVGLKCVTVNEPFFQGHFPGEPIMPGVLIIEGMAQTGGVLARISVMESYGSPHRIAHMEGGREGQGGGRAGRGSRARGPSRLNCPAHRPQGRVPSQQTLGRGSGQETLKPMRKERKRK